MSEAEPLILLVAEDDEGHFELIRRNLRRAGVRNELKHFWDGQEIVDYLKRLLEDESATGSRHLLLLDLRMPKLDGLAVLEWVKGDLRLRTLPVIMLSTTDAPVEIQRCHDLGCNAYVTKPVQYEALAETLETLGLFLSIVRAPRLPA